MAKNCGKHFKCVRKEDYQPLNAISLGILAAALLGAGIFAPGFGYIGGAFLIAAIWDMCRFLRGGKLVCLEDDVCVIGKVMELIPVWSDKDYFERMDDDFTFNILLSPHTGDPHTEDHKDETTQTTKYNDILTGDPVQGKFLMERHDLMPNNLPSSVTYQQEKHYGNLLHCEIKGCGVHNTCIALKIMGVVGAGVGAFCAVVSAGGPLGWLFCLAALLIWALITFITYEIATKASHHGDQKDVLYDPASGEMSLGDVVLIKGDWVVDTGHEGWNEIQPVRFVQKITTMVDSKFHGLNRDDSGNLVKADISLIEKFRAEVLSIWCELAKEADKNSVRDGQKEPENDWRIHPCIDGCKKEVVIK